MSQNREEETIKKQEEEQRRAEKADGGQAGFQEVSRRKRSGKEGEKGADERYCSRAGG